MRHFFIRAVVVSLASLSIVVQATAGAITINNEKPRDFLVDFALFLTVLGIQELIRLPEEARYDKKLSDAEALLQTQAYDNTDSYADFPEEYDEQLRAAFQPILDSIVTYVQTVQRKEPPDSVLNKKGLLNRVSLKIIASNDVGSHADIYENQVLITTRTLIESLRRLTSRNRRSGAFGEIPDDADWDSPGNYSAKYKSSIEFEELIRFILAHEVTHIWLDQSQESVRERENEADAWGIVIAGHFSEALRFRAKESRSFHSPTSDVEQSLLVARAGAEIFLYLYEDDGIFSLTTDRPTYQERLTSVKEEFDLALNRFSTSLSSSDISAFDIMSSAMVFTWPLGSANEKTSLGNECESNEHAEGAFCRPNYNPVARRR